MAWRAAQPECRRCGLCVKQLPRRLTKQEKSDGAARHVGRTPYAYASFRMEGNRTSNDSIVNRNLVVARASAFIIVEIFNDGKRRRQHTHTIHPAPSTISADEDKRCEKINDDDAQPFPIRFTLKTFKLLRASSVLLRFSLKCVFIGNFRYKYVHSGRRNIALKAVPPSPQADPKQFT